MSIRDITLMGHPALMTPAAPVDDPLSEATTSLIEDMFDTMFAIGGVGIAAPQIGVSQRVIICLMRERKFSQPPERDDFTVFINPTLTPVDTEMVEGWEGCLSLPGMQGKVPRYKQIQYTATATDGSTLSGRAVGFPAVVLQHEADHLDGILYPMRMTDMSTLQYHDPVRRLTGRASMATSMEQEIDNELAQATDDDNREQEPPLS